MKQPIPFGKYFLLERINVGGMAEVFKAKATGVEGFERLVAVKRILPSIAEDEEFITMFVDEAKIAVQLTHANIAQIFDLGRVEGSFFIALEYVHGKDLRAIFNRMRQRGDLLPIPLSCYAIMKLCEGLDYAHNKHDSNGETLNLVHRDVSPQNILISYEGEVKIIDFGIAKAAGKAGRTQAGILKGKFGYMSPEQVLGLDIDRRSDVFGVGICLYELLTGERLFTAESDFATLEKVRSVDVMPPSTYNRRIPEELEQIVMRALARDRDQRYQTAMQLHDELQSFMYTSGNLFSRKDLSVYMHRVFGEEIEKESARDQEYAQLGSPNFNAEPSGLEVFDEIDPVSTVSALHGQPGGGLDSQVGGEPLPVASAPARGPRKATLLGIPHVALRPAAKPAPQVPRLIPRLQSIPPSASAPGSAPSAGRAVQQAPEPKSYPPAAPNLAPPLDLRAPRAPSSSPGMEWDDEELSTQIYDKPDDAAFAYMFGHKATSPSSMPSAPPAALVPEKAQQPAIHPARVEPRAAEARSQPSMSVHDELPPWEENKGRARPMLVAVVVVIAIIACIVAGLSLFGGNDPGTIQFATQPSRAEVTLDGRTLESRTSPFVLAQVPAGTPHTISVSSEGYRPWMTSVHLKPGETLQLPTVTLERIETGFAIDSMPPGASVLVDGEKRAETPARLTELTAGEHRIRLELAGYAPWESILQVSIGTVLPLASVALSPAAPEPTPSGRRARSSSASATEDADEATPRHAQRSAEEPDPAGDPEGAEPAPATKAPERATTASSESEAEEPEADEKQAASSAAAEPPAASATGTLRVNSRPWSQVFVDGKLIGATPQRNISLPAGTHTLLLVNEEFGLKKSLSVEIKPGEITTQVLNLE